MKNNYLKSSLVLCSLVSVLTSCVTTEIVSQTDAEAERSPATLLCKNLFPPREIAPLKFKNLNTQLEAGYDAPNVLAYAKFKTLLAAQPKLAEQKVFIQAATIVLRNESLSTLHESFQRIVEQLSSVSHNSTKEQIVEQLKNAVYSDLVKIMSHEEATARAALVDNLISYDAKQANPIKAGKLMMRVLGEMTPQESLVALVGTGGIRNLTGDSLVKRYLDKARESGVEVSTYVGTFKKANAYGGRGGEKLFISVDQNTINILDQILGSDPHLLMHAHTQGQGTLQMRYRGEAVSYSAYDGVRGLRNQVYGRSIIPVMVLGSVEGSNAHNYFTLGSMDRKFAKFPWGLKKGVEETAEQYCRTGGYGSCTHWIGEMPIGETKVNDITVPGLVGDDPYTHMHDLNNNDNTTGLRVKSAGEYTHFKSRSGVEEVGRDLRRDRLTRMVWTQGVSHEQLYSVVGDKNGSGLSKGEWANPGWVLYNFLTRGTQDRVPVVFLVRENSTAPLNEAALDEMATSISEH